MSRNVSGAERPAWRTPELIARQPPHWPEKAEDWLEEACSAAPGVAYRAMNPLRTRHGVSLLKLIEGTVMKLILIAAAAVAFASTSAFACNGIYTPGVHCPQWEMMPMQTPQQAWRPTPLPVPQTAYGSIGNQSFSITQWPNGMVTIDR